MLIVGEKLNSSIPKTLEAMLDGDMEYLVQLTLAQVEKGANFLDINTALCGEKEEQIMEQILEMVQAQCTCGIMLDSPNPSLIKKVIDKIKDREIIINSLTLAQRFNELVPIIKEYNCGIVGLPIDENGIPETVEKRVVNASRLIEKLCENGVNIEKIYIDVLCEAMAVQDGSAVITLKSIEEIKRLYPKVNTICGLSNISFGLPKRQTINAAFLATAIYCGLDSAIMDITNATLHSTLYAALAMAGKDEYCMDYIRANR